MNALLFFRYIHSFCTLTIKKPDRRNVCPALLFSE